MIQFALAVALIAQDAQPASSLDATAWFKAHLKNFDSAKIEILKPPSSGTWNTGGGFMEAVSPALAKHHEAHVVVFHCYRVYPAGGQSYRYLLVEGSDGRVMASKTSGRALEQHCG